MSNVNNVAYPGVFISSHINVWSHNPIVLILALLLMILIGIVKFKWQTLFQIYFSSFILHMAMDYFLYGLPLNFLVPFSPHETQIFGMEIAYIINFHTFDLLTEIFFITSGITLISQVYKLLIQKKDYLPSR